MKDFRPVFLWEYSGKFVFSFFKIASRETQGPVKEKKKKRKKHHSKPYLHPHQNTVPNALIEKDIFETSICYLKRSKRTA